MRTILQAAGVLHDAPLGRQTLELVREVLAPKACGAANLAASLALLGVQRYVSYSSIAALTGPAGSANYAGANACLDAQAAQLADAGEGHRGATPAMGCRGPRGCLAGRVQQVAAAAAGRLVCSPCCCLQCGCMQPCREHSAAWVAVC